MPSRIVFLCLALTMALHATELICSADFNESGVLQSKMETRQLIVSPEVNRNDINQQIRWAKGSGCLYLLQMTATHIRVMNLNTGDYVLEKKYDANFEQLANTLQHPEFIETKIEAKTASSKKKESSNQWTMSIGCTSEQTMELRRVLMEFRHGFLWDLKTIWIEPFLNLKMDYGNYDNNRWDLGIRALYPLSSKQSTFYIGSGGGYSLGNGPFVENSLGYSTKLKSLPIRLPIRLEVFGGAVFDKEKTLDFGARYIIGLTFGQEDTLPPPKKKEVVKENHEKTERSFNLRFAYNSYLLPDAPHSESGWSIKGGIGMEYTLYKNIFFAPEINLVVRNMTLIEKINWNNGSKPFYYDAEITDFGISIPAMLKIMPFGGPWFYIEGGAQIEFVASETCCGGDYNSRTPVDFGLAYGLGWQKSDGELIVGFRGISGLNDFDNTRGKPLTMELALGWTSLKYSAIAALIIMLINAGIS